MPFAAAGLNSGARQQLDGRPLVVQTDVRVDTHCQPYVAVPGQGLGRAGRNASVLQIRDERVAIGVEVGELAGVSW